MVRLLSSVGSNGRSDSLPLQNQHCTCWFRQSLLIAIMRMRLCTPNYRWSADARDWGIVHHMAKVSSAPALLQLLQTKPAKNVLAAVTSSLRWRSSTAGPDSAQEVHQPQPTATGSYGPQPVVWSTSTNMSDTAVDMTFTVYSSFLTLFLAILSCRQPSTARQCPAAALCSHAVCRCTEARSAPAAVDGTAS